MTMAVLHQWVSIEEPTPTLEDLDSFNNSVKNELDATSADEDSATDSRKCIHVGIPKSNLENHKPFLKLAFPSHTRNRNIPDENQAYLLSNSYLKSS